MTLAELVAANRIVRLIGGPAPAGPFCVHCGHEWSDHVWKGNRCHGNDNQCVCETHKSDDTYFTWR